MERSRDKTPTGSIAECPNRTSSPLKTSASLSSLGVFALKNGDHRRNDRKLVNGSGKLVASKRMRRLVTSTRRTEREDGWCSGFFDPDGELAWKATQYDANEPVPVRSRRNANVTQCARPTIRTR